MRPDALEFSYHGKDFLDMRPAPYPSPLRIDHYNETMRFESICDGQATYIDVLTYTCSGTQKLAYDFWYTLHQSTFAGLAASLGATVMAGDCPCA
jgi:hypothetical protein